MSPGTRTYHRDMFQVALMLALLQSSPRPDFTQDVRPILEQRCTPCHFAGGKMYERLPFDKPATLQRLGEERIFTRIKDERERAIIHEFLR